MRTPNVAEAGGRVIGPAKPAATRCCFAQQQRVARLTDITDPLGNQTQTSYDADGNVVSRTDPNGKITATTYDTVNERTLVTYPDGAARQSTYTADTRIASQADQDGRVTTFSYNALNQRTSATDPLSRTTSYTYDAAGVPSLVWGDMTSLDSVTGPAC
jgi:YD repeat-containing protein